MIRSSGHRYAGEMAMELISYVFSGDAWAWLMMTAGARSTASLPLGAVPVLEQGERELLESGCLLACGQQRTAEPVLMNIAAELAQTRWHADLNMDGSRLVCSAGLDCCLIAERLSDGRISVLPLPTVREACQALARRFGDALTIGWRQEETPMEIASMNISALRERLEKTQEEYTAYGKDYR